MSRSDAAARFYTRWASIYDLLARKTPGVASLRAQTVRGMQLEPGMTVLDMGCGPGPNFAPVRRTVGPEGRVIGIDVARGALQRARQHVDRSGWENVHPLRGDATDPPVSDTDAVVAAFVIGMFDEPAETVDAWCTHVGTGGRIGLLHFARSERSYAPVPNALLQALVLISTPEKRRLRGDATAMLDRRVREGHRALIDRCSAYHHETHWGGVVHIVIGTVD